MQKMTKPDIKIFTNHVDGGWSPYDIDEMLGGSEEGIVMLAGVMSQDYNVTVYHTQKEKGSVDYKGVHYLSRDEAEVFNTDILITFKDPTPYLQGATCKRKIHWSSEVEKYWDTDVVDYYVSLSDYHKSRNSFPLKDKSIAIPHGIDIGHLMDNKIPREPKTILYSSSPDRGLFRLLTDWERISKEYKGVKLRITYGFNVFDQVTRGSGNDYKHEIERLINQKGVEFLGTLSRDDMAKEYWRAEYWALPLENPDSELFCINAIKSRYCGVVPIVNKIGALSNTVGDYIDYTSFISGKPTITTHESTVRVSDWQTVYDKFWKPLLRD